MRFSRKQLLACKTVNVKKRLLKEVDTVEKERTFQRLPAILSIHTVLEWSPSFVLFVVFSPMYTVLE